MVSGAWTVVAAKMSAVEHASTSAAVARTEVVSVRFMVASSRVPPAGTARTGWPTSLWVTFMRVR